ncbi:MAG: glycine zipper domain-containing protein [Candidatus Melainabacteria bacterium]|nr:glycine zipper domain-containing protein [Candidatus Melainabacteria bacterium]
MNKSNLARNKLLRPLLLVLGLITVLALSGCATPLGQRYGTIGALGGAVIGGAADGLNGAVIGGAAGAAAGGYIGDQESFDQDRQYREQQQQQQRYYERDYGYQERYQPRQNYQECWYESIYDYDGYEVGRQKFCR